MKYYQVYYGDGYDYNNYINCANLITAIQEIICLYGDLYKKLPSELEPIYRKVKNKMITENDARVKVNEILSKCAQPGVDYCSLRIIEMVNNRNAYNTEVYIQKSKEHVKNYLNRKRSKK